MEGTFPALHKRNCVPWDAYVTPRAAIKDFLETVVPPDSPKTPTMAAFIGGRGTGKTHAATQLAERWHMHGLLVRYTKAMDIFRRIRESYNNSFEKNERTVVQMYTSPHLLVIDEVNVRMNTEWESVILTDIIDTRYAAMRATILISNLTSDAFKESVGASTYDRIRECGAIVEFSGPSLR